METRAKNGSNGLRRTPETNRNLSGTKDPSPTGDNTISKPSRRTPLSAEESASANPSTGMRKASSASAIPAKARAEFISRMEGSGSVAKPTTHQQNIFPSGGISVIGVEYP